MASLRENMAEYGFESNESFDYVVRCLQTFPGPNMRCLNIEGDSGRRKTAFANALAHAMDVAHVLYYDFTQSEEPTAPAVVKVDDENGGKEEPPVGLFDRTLSDVCAFSEAEKTILILDQLQAADFKEHIRIYRFLTECEWRYGDAVFYANRKNLYVFLISEEPLYHSLQKNSFKVWISGASVQVAPYRPADFKLGPDAESLLTALHNLFQELQIYPTFSEYKKIIYDIQHNVRFADDLKTSIYGWTEAINREQLIGEEFDLAVKKIMPVVETFIGFDENVELTDIPDNPPE